jgi:hypothetical protein
MTVGFEPTHVLRNALAGHPLKTTRASHQCVQKMLKKIKIKIKYQNKTYLLTYLLPGHINTIISL